MNKRGILIWHLCIILILSVQYTKEKPCSFLTYVCRVLHKTSIKQSIFSMHQWQTVSGNCFLEFGHKRTHIYTLRNIFGLLISARARDVSGMYTWVQELDVWRTARPWYCKRRIAAAKKLLHTKNLNVQHLFVKVQFWKGGLGFKYANNYTQIWLYWST